MVSLVVVSLVVSTVRTQNDMIFYRYVLLPDPPTLIPYASP